MITISCVSRQAASKGNVRRLRREGFIPYVAYANGQPTVCGSVAKADVEAAFRSIAPGSLPTTVFLLKDGSGRDYKAVVREVQYKPTTYDIVHIDFLELVDDHKLAVKVPVECIHTLECAGVKLGGQLRYVMRHVTVRCLPKDIPDRFVIDIKDLGIHQSKRVKDLAIPSSVRCLAHPNDVVVSVNK